MQKEKVAILLSTYNGEKYIKEQLDSIIAQTYKNIEIYVRDDGSKDNTIKILKEYGKKINLIEGKNIGFIKSFFELLSICDDADYYSFCDQDDVWMKDKIKNSVSKLNTLDVKKPILYASNFDYYDSDMKYVGHSKFKNKKPSFENCLVECIAPGMTMCINDQLRKFLISRKPEVCLFHDWWIYMVCMGIGTVIYDEQVTVKYRQHTNNVTTERQNFLKLQIDRIKKFIVGKQFQDISKQLKEYENICGSMLNKNNKKLLYLFTTKKTLTTQLKKIFYKKKYRFNMIDDFLIRLMFLIGKL